MFGMGPSEIVVIALIFLLVFGPGKMPQMARDIGKFVGQARGAIDEFKDELTIAGAEDETERPQRSRQERSRQERSRQERGRERGNGQGRANGSREDEAGDGEGTPEDGSPDGAGRERAEYDL